MLLFYCFLQIFFKALSTYNYKDSAKKFTMNKKTTIPFRISSNPT